MSDDGINSLKEIKEILEAVPENKEELHGQITKFELNNKQIVDCYFTRLFVLVATINENDEYEYHLHFIVNTTKLYIIAYYTHIISMYFLDDLYIMEDVFFDVKSKKVVFGDEAYTYFEEKLYFDQGLVKCNVCDRYINSELMLYDKGYCKICDEIELPEKTFH